MASAMVAQQTASLHEAERRMAATEAAFGGRRVCLGLDRHSNRWGGGWAEEGGEGSRTDRNS